MDKLYTEKTLPYIDAPLPSAPKHVELEHIKTAGAYPKKITVAGAGSSSPLDKKFNRFVKRGFDILLSSVFIICILSWLVPLIAILIKLDSKGPVFFLQKRTGLNGKLFTCIKFRSMIVNAEADLLAEQENDSRITRLGKMLRLYHIDELPQFLNVLMGHMSSVGPRPYMIVENKKFETIFSQYNYRHSVKPGITGFAQSEGNFGPTIDPGKLSQRMQQDVFYIQQWSTGMDIKILFRTARMMLQKS